jgi:tRNA(adenine34) deaminase
MSERSFMDQALELARLAESQDEVPIGAVLVYRGKIIGEGHNQRETLQDPLSHAEIHALQDAAQKLGSWRLLDCELYVTLEPCPMCLAACQQARISKVIYGAHDPKGGAISLGYRLHEDARINHRFLVEYRENPACSQILTDFFRTKRN